MRKVLVSPSFGAGWSTWNRECGQALAEDPELVALVEAGEHRGTTPDNRRPNAIPHECSPKFLARAQAVAAEAGVRSDDEVEWAPYCGGVPSLQVVEVVGRYRIEEYDGSESIVREGEQEWW